MLFKAYRRNDGAFVLVPDCCVASRDAERRHGPLRFTGHVDPAAQADAALWRRVENDIDRQSYAVVRQDTGLRLLSTCMDMAHAG